VTATIERSAGHSMPHPKIRQRRIEVRRDEGRRRLRRLLVVAAAAAVVLSGLAISRSSLMDVDRVQVTGGRHTSADEIAAASGVRNHQPMVEVDTEGAAERVEALPWVAQAEVTRRWPADVRIQVSERSAVAQVATEDGRWVRIDADGRLLDLGPAPFEGLVRLTNTVTGRPGDDLGGRLAPSRTVAASIDAPLDQHIVEIGEHDDGKVELRLAENGGKVLFGSAEDVPEKLRALEQLLTTGPRLCPIWDVRVPSAPVLTPGNGCV
jgi:cell division protein FtsQ